MTHGVPVTRDEISVLERLLELWGLPPKKRNPRQPKDGWWRNRKRAVSVVMRELEETFSTEEVTDQVSELLRRVAARYRSGDFPGGDELSMSECCIVLAVADDGVTISKELAKEIVGGFLSPYSYVEVQSIIARYLDGEEVMQVILDGLRDNAAPTHVTVSNLQALRHYRKSMQMSAGSETASKLKQAIGQEIEALLDSDTERIRKSAQHALRSLEALDSPS